MDTRLARPAGRSLYRQRQAIIEPVFGDIKTNRRITRFLRRGHDLVRAEWHWILTGHGRIPYQRLPQWSWTAGHRPGRAYAAASRLVAHER